jgi:putative transposase
MSRKQRICLPDSTYHAISRCIEKRHLLRPDVMKELMHQVLNKALEKYNFELISYSLMDNHFHFLIKTVKNGETISRIMQFIKSQFARRYNRIMDRTGPFWNERFKDTIIERTTNPVLTFWYLFMHIGYNPVRSKYVNDPRKYHYCGFRAYLDRDYVPPVPITYHEYFLQLGNTYEERIKKLLEFEEMYRRRIFPKGLFSL